MIALRNPRLLLSNYTTRLLPCWCCCWCCCVSQAAMDDGPRVWVWSRASPFVSLPYPSLPPPITGASEPSLLLSREKAGRPRDVDAIPLGYLPALVCLCFVVCSAARRGLRTAGVGVAVVGTPGRARQQFFGWLHSQSPAQLLAACPRAAHDVSVAARAAPCGAAASVSVRRWSLDSGAARQLAKRPPAAERSIPSFTDHMAHLMRRQMPAEEDANKPEPSAREGDWTRQALQISRGSTI